MLPMMANPAVEPSARWALMIPDAMPARSGGTDDIATLVAGVTARPPAAAHTGQTDENQYQGAADAGAQARSAR